jgi:NADH-quinone oxidoreductase subunit J
MRLRQLLSLILVLLLLPASAHADQLALAAEGAGTAGGVSGTMVAFWIFGVLTVAGAVLTVTLRNPVTAAMFLVLTLFSTGGLYLVLHATFLAAIQVLVYAGAIMVLFIFVVMAVARYDAEELGIARNWFPKALGLAAIALLGERLLGVVTAGYAPEPGLVADGFGDVNSISKLLFAEYLFPFEALSLLLLVAIIGAVMVTRRSPPRADDTGEKGNA